ncbi:MAG: WD40 repeat domain-containing protein, partial [Flectobacillus sp.]|uniref:WD40 repeat domain-containing protein n=1 Tax=Flectobacillus sp. TaxID=50419 RepID=UPI003B9DAC6A
MTEATKIENEKTPNYGNAIRKLYSAQIAARDCSPAKETEVKERIIHLFEKIEKLRVAAEEAKNKAVASEQKAQIAMINATALFWASEAKKYNSIQGLQFVKKAMSTAKSENTIQSIKETTASIFNNGFVDKFTLIKSKTYLPKANIKDIGIITAPSFSKDGRWMIVHYSESPYYRILNVPGLNGFNPLEKEYYISSYFFSDDCKWLLTKSGNQSNELKYKLWNLQKGKSQIFTYKGEQIKTLKFSSDGKWLTTTDIMDMSILWDLNSNKGYLLPSDIININFSSDCKWIITSSNDNEYKLYNLNGEIIPKFLSNNTYNFISITDDCKWLITKNNDDVYKLWNINTQEEATFISIGDSIPIVALSSENKWLIAKYENGHCRVWDLSNMQFDDFLKNEIDIVNTKFSVDGSILINFHANNQNKVWNLKNKKAFDFLQNEIGITYAEADSNFNYLVTTDGKETIKVWDIKGEKQRLEGLSIYKYRFSDYGTLLLKLNNGVQLYEINLKNKNETLFDLSRFNVSNPYSYSFYGISPDFRWIGVVIEGDFSYELWNLKTINEQIKSVFKQEHPVERTQVSSDSKWLVTTDINNTAKVWSVEKEIQANFLKEEATIHKANFSPDSKWLIITNN